ncbi:MAG: hypothetical protein AVDCRST_MAG71-1086, partial [uncultured Lysobacter sp.]
GALLLLPRQLAVLHRSDEATAGGRRGQPGQHDRCRPVFKLDL